MHVLTRIRLNGGELQPGLQPWSTETPESCSKDGSPDLLGHREPIEGHVPGEELVLSPQFGVHPLDGAPHVAVP
jgi:hypothetical protein